MKRVLVIGSGGSGKTTFAGRLHERTGLPLVHLDALYWTSGWVATPAEQWEAVVSQLVQRPEWIMDGNYGGTLPMRMAAADTVVFLDVGRLRCLFRLALRRLRFAGRSRPSLPDGCSERLTWEFVRWVWTYPARRRPGILRQLEALGDRTRVVVLRTARDIETFLASVAPRA